MYAFAISVAMSYQSPDTIGNMSGVITANGRNGLVQFDGKTVTIKREGAAARLTHGRSEKMLSLRQIAAVQMKPVSMLTAGYIQFTVPGEASNRTAKGGRTFDASKDENSVLFLKKSEDDFARLRDAVMQAIANL